MGTDKFTINYHLLFSIESVCYLKNDKLMISEKCSMKNEVQGGAL
jgi:hypothetical protein